MFESIYREEFHGLAVGRVNRSENFTASLGFYHNEYQIQYITQGERYFFYDGVCTKMGAGTMALIDKGMIPKTCIIGGRFHDRLLLEMEDACFTGLCRGMGMDFRAFFASHHGVYHVQEGETPWEVFHKVDALMREAQEPEREGKLKLLVLGLLMNAEKWEMGRCEAMGETAARSSLEKQRKVHLVADYIAENYTQDCSAQALADRFYLSKSYLCRIFREVTNFTISEYVNLYRIAASKTYLLQEEMGMAQIAQRLGYESLTYFERVFKKQMSISPLQFRIRNRNPK